MNTQMTEPLLDTPALAELLGLTVGGIRNMLCRNPEHLPPPVRIGRRVRWRRTTVERWLASREPPIEPLPPPRGRPRNGPDGFPAGGRRRPPTRVHKMESQVQLSGTQIATQSGGTAGRPVGGMAGSSAAIRRVKP